MIILIVCYLLVRKKVVFFLMYLLLHFSDSKNKVASITADLEVVETLATNMLIQVLHSSFCKCFSSFFVTKLLLT